MENLTQCASSSFHHRSFSGDLELRLSNEGVVLTCSRVI